MQLAKSTSDLELKELPRWKKIAENNVKIYLKRFIKNKEVVSRQELVDIWGKSVKTIQRYIKDGMPIHPESTRVFQFFNLEEVTTWRDRSIDKVMSQKTAKPSTTEIEVNIDVESDGDESLVALDDMSRKLKADADDAELKVKLNTIKLAEAEGRVVDANDLDRAMGELATVHKTDKIHDENLLPILLENKNAGEIKKLLQEHNFERLEMLDKIVNREFKSVETMYDVVEVVLQQLRDGVEPESLVKRLKGSLV